jgi:hypothetical protein
MGTRIDYLKFIFTTEYDRFQANINPLLTSLQHNYQHDLARRYPAKLTPLGADTGGKRRYVYECWGDFAHTVAAKAPLWFWQHVRRIDVRAETDFVTLEQLQGLGSYYACHQNGRVNVDVLNSRPRHKDADRDIGGVGIRIGSRKSDHHAVFYKRGAEKAAFEYRRQGKAAVEAGLAIREAAAYDDTGDVASIAVRYMQGAAEGWLFGAMGVRTAEKLALAGEQYHQKLLAVGDVPTPSEIEEAERWAENNQDDFEQMKLAQFDTTPKGRKEP